MNLRTWIVFGMLGIFGSGGAVAQLQPGDALATCFSNNQGSGSVIGAYDIGDPVGEGAPLGATLVDWQGRERFHWVRSQFDDNEIFGIALDDATPSPNAYVTSTVIYKTRFAGLPVFQQSAGTGKVFRIAGSQAAGAVTALATLPQDLTKAAGQGLGNIAFDSSHRQLFVTNFYDGKIYRLATNGQLLDTIAFDPFQTFGSYTNTPGGFAPLGERVWGVGVFRDRLYFARWGKDVGMTVTNNGIFSISLDVLGKPSGPVKDELISTSMPVSDIEFASDGRMLLAERSMRTTLLDEAFTWAHASQLLEYQLTGTGAWVPSGHDFKIGKPPTSAAGGADYSCPLGRTSELVVATGDALINVSPPTRRVYGLQISASTGGMPEDSFLVDLNGFTGDFDKTEIGDVDVYNTCDRQCSGLTGVQITCVTDRNGVPIPGQYLLSFQIQNNSPDTIYNAFLVGLPGATKTHFPFPHGLAAGAVSAAQTTIITGGTAGQQLTFQLTLHDQELNECCATRHTITLPRCDCAQVLGQKGPFCKFFPFGSYNYSFTLQNLNPAVQPAFVIVVPETPSTAVISKPINTFSGSSQTVPLTFSNVSPGQQVCFLASLHTADFERCCSIRHCVTVPRCFEPIDPRPIDVTHLSFEEGGLVLDDSGGTPGCTFPLDPGTTGFDLTWSDAELAGLSVGGSIEQIVNGTVDASEPEVVARTVSTRTLSGAELLTQFPTSGATRHRYEFYLDGERTGMLSGVGKDVPAICNCGPNFTTDAHFVVSGFVPASQEGPAPCAGNSLRCMFSRFTFKQPNRFDIPDFPGIFLADEVRVFPEDGDPRVEALTSVTIQAFGIPRLTLVDFAVQGDCNDNGIPDFDEITRGGGLDLDLDGILDVCQAVVPLVIDLSTGFDQAAGVPLPGRAEDEDWRFVSPGPAQAARVVDRPTAAWAAPLPGSKWVSVEPETGSSLPGVRFLHFERTFCLTDEARNLVLEVALRADDRAVVRLNGQTLAGPGGGFASATPLTVQRAGAVGDGLFVAGENRLEVEVRDPGAVVTGFDLAGSLTGPTGACLVP